MQRREYAPLIGFGLRFFAVFALLSLGFEAVRDGPIGGALIDTAVLAPTVAILAAVDPDERVTLENRTLLSPGSRLTILRGCEGIEMLFLIAAAVTAFPAGVNRRLRGLSLGTLVCWLVSVGRLLALHYTLRYAPAAWELMHGIVAPLLPIATAGLYFLAWTGVGRHPAAAIRAQAV